MHMVMIHSWSTYFLGDMYVHVHLGLVISTHACTHVMIHTDLYWLFQHAHVHVYMHVHTCKIQTQPQHMCLVTAATRPVSYP